MLPFTSKHVVEHDWPVSVSFQKISSRPEPFREPARNFTLIISSFQNGVIKSRGDRLN